jgi:hypothetical protein
MLPRSKGKDDAAAGASAAASICELCDLYTRNDLDGKWTELAEVYDVRQPSISLSLSDSNSL